MVRIQDFSALGDLMNQKSIDEAVNLAKDCWYVEAADKLDQLNLSPEQKQSHSELFAHAYYRRALNHQCNKETLNAINDLEKALGFPGLENPLRRLIQDRRTAIQNSGNNPKIKNIDNVIEKYFEKKSSSINLREEFLLRKYGLDQPHRILSIDGIDERSCIGVYRWTGDPNYDEKWSQIIRKFKKGDESLPAFFGRILTEHIREITQCTNWLIDIDFIIPVPDSSRRTAERGINIVGQMAEHLGDRLAIPTRIDLLKRNDTAAHAKELRRDELVSQYSFDSNKKQHIRARTVLLLDDVVTRGHTASVCAEKLKAAGCRRVYLLTLAQAESTHQSKKHFGEAISDDVDRLTPWLCLSDTERLGPVRVKALLQRFTTATSILHAEEKDLRDVSAVGPKVAEAILDQSKKIDEYPDRATKLLSQAKRIDARIMTLEDPDYPVVLKNSDAAPAVLYALGSQIDVLHKTNTVAIVGSRKPVDFSVDMTCRIATALAKAGWLIISGMAEGVDSIAHTSCLEENQSTIAFLGNGVDVTYPPSAKSLQQDIIRRGVLVSEYPFGMRVDENRLRRRNSLTVGHSNAVIIIQSSTDGGTMNAARAAERLVKPLFCLEPLPEFSSQFSGNEELLRSKKAQPISPENAVDLILSSNQHDDPPSLV